MEQIEIDLDSDMGKIISTIDKNHNIDKNIQHVTETSTATTTASTIASTSCFDLSAKMHCESILISDSEDELAENTKADNKENKYDTATNNDQIGADADNNIEKEQNRPKTEPISARTRSSRRPNLVSYNEDESSTSRDEPESLNEFPKGPTKSIFQVDKIRVPKNNDKAIFYSNFLYKSICLLCGCSDKNLASHYAKRHADETEVLIARLSPKYAARIRNQDDFFRIEGKIHGLCVFCEELQTLAMDDWKKHILNHTGEQMYQCNGCQMSVHRIKHNHGQCSKEKVQNIFEGNSLNGDLIGFICNTCHYLQVSENRIIKHIEAEHDSFDNAYSELFSRVILVKSPSTL